MGWQAGAARASSPPHHHPPFLYKCRGAECSPTPYTNPEERSRKGSDAREEEGHPATEAAPRTHQPTSPIPSPLRRRRGRAGGQDAKI